MNSTERTADNCYFKCQDYKNGCRAVRDEYPCCPTTCKWHRTKEEMLESLYKAACTYEKATGYSDYHVRFVPMSLRSDFVEYQAKRKREKNGN